MIRFTKGDILDADAEALVNTVNCVGIMGRGVALQFKNAFPANYKAYAAACKRGEVQPGRMFVYDTGELTRPRWIINFPTKRHWRGKSRIEDIDAGLAALTEEIRSHGIRSVAIPPLGSGLGGLDWAQIRPLIERALSELRDVEATVFEPGGGPEDTRTNRSRDVPRMTPGRAAVVGLMRRYLAGMMDTSISLLEVHKLTYFLQEAGQPLKLRFVEGLYGPYSENLRFVLQEMDGHMVAGWREGDPPDAPISLVPGAVEEAEAVLDADTSVRQKFDRVSALVSGFETPFGLELLATTHWVTEKKDARTDDEVIRAVYEWHPRKKRFSRDQIQIALEELRAGGWLPAATA